MGTADRAWRRAVLGRSGQVLQLLNQLATGYISPLALKILPFSGQTLMHIIGVIEMIVGLAILTKWTRLGSYVASAWLVAIAINLVSTGIFFDIAVRDLEMAVAAFVLARMTEVRSEALNSDALPGPLAKTVVAA